MAAYDGQSGSKDRGDPQVRPRLLLGRTLLLKPLQTTNLFVANLPIQVTEPNLGKFFARAGPVGSVCFLKQCLTDKYHCLLVRIGQSHVASD